MEKKQHSQRFLRQRKFMMVLPLLVLPFLTMTFWALGGGSGSQTAIAKTTPGLNLQLPDANLKDERNLDKLSFYKEADADSLKREEILRNDPYYKDSISMRQQSSFTMPAVPSGLNRSPYSGSVDANEQRIYQKVAELNQQINAPVNTASANPALKQANPSNDQFSGDVDRLQSMMQLMTEKQQNDPEMQQLDGTLEKILDIQHPGRVRDKLREQSLKNKQQVFTVSNQKLVTENTYFQTGDTGTRQKHNDFYEESTNSKSLQHTLPNAVAAVVHETQTVTNGSTVKLRLTTDVFINGLLVPKGSFVFGTASLENERLLITIPNIRYGNNLLPVALSVHDMDGLAGIHIPGSVNRDVAKQSADQSLQSVEFMSLDPSLKGQATAAGVSAAKSLLSKKVKLIKVTVKAGYQVLLKDNNQQNS
jgi:conjugative transposon TraM protein